MAYRDIVLKHRLTPEADGAGGLGFNGPSAGRSSSPALPGWAG